MMANKADLVRELLRVFKVLGKPFSRREYDEIAEIHSDAFEKEFGTWTQGLKAAGLLEKFTEYKEVSREMRKFNPGREVKKEWKTEKEELKKRAEERKLEWLKKQLYKKDLLREMLEETLAKAEPPVVEVNPIKVEIKKGPRSHCTLWFEFSDLQLGTLITSEEMGGLNAHNWIVWKEKLNVWTKAVIRKIAHYRENFEIDNVVIACLGDMVEGQDIFKGQKWQIDRHVVDQALLGANDTAAAFLEIFLSHQEISFHILEVFGNHGRIGQKGENPYSCSMDKVYQRFLALQLRAADAATNFVYHENEAWFYLLDIYGWNHLLLHGDQGISGLWSNRPTVNGLEKGVTRYNQMLQQQIHFVHVGHFHQNWNLSFNMSSLLLNGSFVGTSNFSAHQMVASSPPCQTMHVFEPQIGLARTEIIYLTEGQVKRPITPHTLQGAVKKCRKK